MNSPSDVNPPRQPHLPALPAKAAHGGDPGLQRTFGVLHATALNMSNMVGVGPFITIPLILSAMGGPQCLLGWVLGALLSLCDGMVWSELAAAMPGSGGTYHYLRKAFGQSQWGVLLT